jgi:hypothetical protein
MYFLFGGNESMLSRALHEGTAVAKMPTPQVSKVNELERLAFSLEQRVTK